MTSHDRQSEIVNIIDKPVDGVYGNYFFDDEGVLCQKTPILENGVLTHFLHSRITASLLEMREQLHGNGRRENFMHPIYPRNSNTFLEPGDYSFEEMISEMKCGILMSKGSFGMEDFDGSIHCNSKTGFLIENGEITTRVKGIAISGSAIDMFMAADAITKGPVDYFGLESRKGLNEIVPVTYGGVYLRTQKGFISPG